jgi:pyruvate/2-oxoglutarate dehydrogenase complex dihydrolipoamide dehydrogenase (E3) component
VYRASFVVWAAGEFQYPRLGGFQGADLGVHNATVQSWQKTRGKEHVVIGGYESGIDAAVNLAMLGRKVRVLDGRAAWADDAADPSVSLSPYTRQRLRRAQHERGLELLADKRVIAIERDGKGYAIQTDDGEWITTESPPILATGFEGGLRRLSHLFEWRDDGQPSLNEVDESTLTPNLFVSGPSVRQDGHIFCFIYKFRQRFAVVANAIGERLGMDTSGLEAYRSAGMFLDDLSCCGASCAC